MGIQSEKTRPVNGFELRWWSKRDHQSCSRKLCIASLFSSFNSAAHTQNWTNGGKCSAEWLTLDILCWEVQCRMANYSHSTSEIWLSATSSNKKQK
eukprot:scaffold1743_cov77-Skeletonema_dohrnii-CCMP3373.AAC.2